MTQITPHIHTQIDEKISAWQRGLVNDVQGLVVCMRDDHGDIVFRQAYGAHDKFAERPQPLSADALFPVASHAKLLTATAIHQLIDEERAHPATRKPLGLDDKIITLLPELNLDWMQDITLRDALSHFTRMGFDHAERDMSPQAFREKGLAGITPDKEVGYSNRMYGWLQFIIQDISGMDFNTYITKEIVQRHGLGEIYPSRNAVPVEKLSRIPRSYAGDNADQLTVLRDFQAMAPSGGAYATADALTLLVFKLAHGEILRRQKVDKYRATGMFVPRNKNGVTWNGLGAFVYSFKSDIVDGRETNPLSIPDCPLNDHGDFFGHTGWIGGASRSHTGYNPQTGLTVSVVFTISDKGDFAPHDVLAIAFRTIFNATMSKPNRPDHKLYAVVRCLGRRFNPYRNFMFGRL